MEQEKQFIIIKKVAKQGKQSMIVIPRILENRLKPGTILKLTMDILEEAGEQKEFASYGGAK